MRPATSLAAALALAPLSMALQAHDVPPPQPTSGLDARALRDSGDSPLDRIRERINDRDNKENQGQNGQRNGQQGREANGRENGTRLGGVSRDAVIVVNGASQTQGGPPAIHTIKVGGPNGLVFQPAVNQFAVGSTVVWEFYSKNHSVVQSSFAKPCEPLKKGFNTGFKPNPNDANPPPQAAMNITSNEPLWFYCSQADHCQKGMVVSINAPLTGDKKHAEFQRKAQGGAAPAGQPPAEQPPAGQPPATGAPGTGASIGTSTGSTGAEVVRNGVGTLENGACNCVVQCKDGAAGQSRVVSNSSSTAGQTPSVLGRRQQNGQPCECTVSCGSASSSSSGDKGVLRIAMISGMSAASGLAISSGAGGIGGLTNSSGTASSGGFAGTGGTTSSLGATNTQFVAARR